MENYEISRKSEFLMNDTQFHRKSLTAMKLWIQLVPTYIPTYKLTNFWQIFALKVRSNYMGVKWTICKCMEHLGQRLTMFEVI